jgi:hypothetical protein
MAACINYTRPDGSVYKLHVANWQRVIYTRGQLAACTYTRGQMAACINYMWHSVGHVYKNTRGQLVFFEKIFLEFFFFKKKKKKQTNSMYMIILLCTLYQIRVYKLISFLQYL